MRLLFFALLAGSAVASPTGGPSKYGGASSYRTVISSLEKLLQGVGTPTGPITNQILMDYVEPVKVSEASSVEPWPQTKWSNRSKSYATAMSNVKARDSHSAANTGQLQARTSTG